LRGSARDRALHLVERCGGGREFHGRWTVCCPAHDDRHPSLGISYDLDRVVLHCYAGCEAVDILSRLGLTWQDLFDDGRDHRPPPKRKKHLGPRIPEPPGGPTSDNLSIQLALELIIDDCSLLQVEACQDLFRRMATDPLTRLWIEQQLRHHQLDPALVWRVVQPAPTAPTGGLRMVTVNSPPHHTAGGAA
jgi:hypothetical protein